MTKEEWKTRCAAQYMKSADHDDYVDAAMRDLAERDDFIERLRALASAQAARAVSAEFERDALQAEYERGRAQDAEPLPTTQMRAYGTACAAAEREACQHIADWEPTREAIQSAIRARGAVTMGEMYGDGSAHEACQSCGMCLRCGDCICAPNVGIEPPKVGSNDGLGPF